MLTEKQQKICDKYSARGPDGRVRCSECPLVISLRENLCKAVAHYDRSRKEWMLDD